VTAGSHHRPRSAGHLRRAAIAVAAVLVLLAIVGASARRPLDGGAEAPALPIWPLLVVAGAGLVLGTALAAATFSPLALGRRDRAARVRPGPLTIALVILVPLVILAAVVHPVRLDEEGRPAQPPVGTHEPRQPKPEKPGPDLGNGAAALAAGIAAGIVGLAAVGIVGARRRARRPGIDTLSSRAVVAAGAGEAMEEIAIPADPRAAVLAAYARMEATFARAGLARRASETPREYLARLEAALGGGRAPAERLTTLFERARFSPHAIDERVRAEAIDALAALRAELGGAT
jgi:Domain of unknown function (DUF4129)